MSQQNEQVLNTSSLIKWKVEHYIKVKSCLKAECPLELTRRHKQVPNWLKIIKSYYLPTLNNTINNKKPPKVAEINNNYQEFAVNLFRLLNELRKRTIPSKNVPLARFPSPMASDKS